MKWLTCFTVCGVFLASVSLGGAQPAARSICLDPLLDWQNPRSVTPDKLTQLVDFAKYNKVPLPDGHEFYDFGNELSSSTQFNVLAGRVKLEGFTCGFKDGQLARLSFYLGQTKGHPADPVAVQALKDEITRQVGDLKPSSFEVTLAPPSKSRRTGNEWRHQYYTVQLFEVSNLSGGKYKTSGQFHMELDIRGGAPSATEVVKKEDEGPKPSLSANLDALLNFGPLWQWSPEDFEKAYTPKAGKEEDQKEPPQFEWLSASKDRARFSRHMFGNVETKLTMFGGSINVEEAVVEFVNGKAARATLSFYNRGDSGDISKADFDRVFKTVGQNLGQVTKVAPKRQVLSSNAALPVTGWMWSAPAAIALLEYNDYTKGGQPEFLRLKLAAPSQADWNMGRLATGIQRMELLKRVTKRPDGDVFISGVPMVDQGQKGYCVAASCQRLFEYMRIPCDQHEMAKLVSIDAESGADVRVMQRSLAKIDGTFNVTFKPLINPEVYYSNNGKRRVSEKEFLSLVKEYTDKGVPLLWGLSLGQKPENPPLPNGGQVSGGHMRLIIGYNAAKRQLLFTDSWGAGHELKRMEMLDAYDVTMGVYSMAPRGL